jgi:hypothetical protein
MPVCFFGIPVGCIVSRTQTNLDSSRAGEMRINKKRCLEEQDSLILPEETSIIIQVWTESNKKRRGAANNKQRKLVAQVDDNFFKFLQ